MIAATNSPAAALALRAPAFLGRVAAWFAPADPAESPRPRPQDVATPSDALAEVRVRIARGNLAAARRLLVASGFASATPAPLHLVGVICEAEGNLMAARSAYRGASALVGPAGYDPSRNNLRRLHELATFGQTRREMELGDEAELRSGFGGRVGAAHLASVRQIVARA